MMIFIGVIGIRDFASVRETMEGLGMMGIDGMECLADCIESPWMCSLCSINCHSNSSASSEM
jgi:hypothetical protein